MSSPPYPELLRWLYGLQWKGMKLGLERMSRALQMRGAPHVHLPVVHVAGTNGKGSVAAMVESAVRHAGLRTGLFTSPHLHRFAERLRIGGEPTPEPFLRERLTAIRTWLERTPNAPSLTFFEVTTLLAIELFAEADVDLAVFEVGLGGRFDATNVFPSPLATAVVSVGLDHTHLLGNSLAQVAWEKAGIARCGVPLVTGPLPEEAMESVRRAAAEARAPLWRLDHEIRRQQAGDGLWRIEAPQGTLDGLRPPLLGAHQHDNLAVAAALLIALRAAGLACPEAALRQGLAATRWPGRLEHIERVGAATILLDVAHNPDGCATLARHLARHPRRPNVLIFGAMRDKDHREMLAPLAPFHDHVLLTAPSAIPRAASPRELHEVLPTASPIDSPWAALLAAERLATPAGRIVVAGSLFLVAEVRARVRDVPSDPPIPL